MRCSAASVFLFLILNVVILIPGKKLLGRTFLYGGAGFENERSKASKNVPKTSNIPNKANALKSSLTSFEISRYCNRVDFVSTQTQKLGCYRCRASTSVMLQSSTGIELIKEKTIFSWASENKRQRNTFLYLTLYRKSSHMIDRARPRKHNLKL